MEFRSFSGDRSTPPPRAEAASRPPTAHPAPHGGRRKHIDWATRTVRLELFILLLGIALLLVALSLYFWSSSNASTEFDKVNKNKYQAVFLNGGATSGSVAYTTYFGHILKINDKYVVLRDVFYLTTDQTSQNNQSANPQLTKLGCQQLHSPYDEMVINRSQVAFWENLQDSGKVATAIKQWQQQNPNGPNCNASTNTNTQNQGTTNQSTSNKQP